MKKRRMFLSLFMLLSLSFIGVGYAALTNTLDVDGKITATKNDNNLKVEFVASKAHNKHPDGSEATTFQATHSVSGKEAEVIIENINEVGSYSEFVLVIKNNSVDLEDDTVTLDALLDENLVITLSGDQPATDSDTSNKNSFEGEHFTVSAYYDNTYTGFGDTYADSLVSTIPSSGSVELAVGKVVFLVVRVELTTPVNINDSDAFPVHTFNIKFNATTPDLV